jgi:hypothetical protein
MYTVGKAIIVFRISVGSERFSRKIKPIGNVVLSITLSV